MRRHHSLLERCPANHVRIALARQSDILDANYIKRWVFAEDARRISPLKFSSARKASIKISPVVAALGDFEGDTIVSGGRNKSVLVTLVDRKSGCLLTGKLSSRTATRTREKIVALLLPQPADHRHSINFDNGKEFSEHEALSRSLGIQAFVAHPYCSWERSTNENTNGLVRQYYPYSTVLAARGGGSCTKPLHYGSAGRGSRRGGGL